MANIDYAGLFTGGGEKVNQPSPFTSSSREQQLLGFAAKQNEALTGRLGGMFGLQQQDPVELAKTKLVGLDPTNPADQPQFIQLLNIVDPGKAAQFKQQLEAKKVTDAEKAASKKLEQERFDITRSDKTREQELAERKVAATEADLKARNIETTKVEIYDQDLKQNVTQWVLKSDPNVVVRTEKSPVDAVKEYASIQRIIDQSSNLSIAASNKERSAIQTATLLETKLPTAGFVGTLEEAIKAAGGTQDDASMARTRAEELVQSEAIASLPQGPATDKDIELARRGQPPANADAKYLASYARGIAKLARKEAQYYRDKSAWYSLHNTPKGFLASQTIKRSEETLEGLTTPTAREMMQKVRDSYGQPNEQDNRIVFEELFGFDLKNLDQDYALAKQVVEKVTGGN